MSDRGAPEGYIDVASRIEAFYAKHPEGSLRRQGAPKIIEVGDKTFVMYTALAYRSPDDTQPGMGTAWEPFPGPTPFTRDSELMNAETSAWGRAIAALGFEVRSGIATAEDVRNRGGSNGRNEAQTATTPKQVNYLAALLKQWKAKEKDIEGVRAWASTAKIGGRDGVLSRAIDALKGDDKTKAEDTRDWLVAQAAAPSLTPDVPADDADLEPALPTSDDVPF